MLSDYYGRAIEPGVKVVFNYSGYPRFGEVASIGKTTVTPAYVGASYSYTRTNIRVTHRDNPSQVSLVKHPHNLVVLS